MTAPPAWYRAGQPSQARLLGLSIAVGLVLLAAACVLAIRLADLDAFSALVPATSGRGG